ncbi:MAG: hypothetical protein ACOCSO_02810, partial [Thermoplasmatota archaeon]
MIDITDIGVSMRQMAASRISGPLAGIRNSPYHLKELRETDLIKRIRTEVVGNMVEKYHNPRPGEPVGGGRLPLGGRIGEDGA